MINEKEAVSLLRKYSRDKEAFENVYAHSKAVQKAALEIGRKAKADLGFIRVASLLHDIGRFSCRPGTKDSIKHGIIGGKILRKEGLVKYAKVAECHIGIGITKKDIIAQKLPLPKKDFVPKTKEEKIITYADNLIFGSIRKSEMDVAKRFRKEFGDEFAERVIKFNNNIKELIKDAKKG